MNTLQALWITQVYEKNHLNYTQTVNNSRSQNQTYTTFCSIDDRRGKHSAKGLRTDALRTTSNIHVRGVEKLLFSGVFLLFLSRKNKKD